MNLQIGLLEVGIALAVLAGGCGITWFAADAHYSQALSSLEGQLEGAAAAQKAAVNAQIKMDQDAAKEVDNEAKQQIGSMADTISYLSTLSMRKPAGGSTITVRPAAPGPAIACVQPDRPAIATGDRPVPEPAKPASEPVAASAATIPADVLDGVLTVGQDALKAELLYREYLRRTGQVKGGP